MHQIPPSASPDQRPNMLTPSLPAVGGRELPLRTCTYIAHTTTPSCTNLELKAAVVQLRISGMKAMLTRINGEPKVIKHSRFTLCSTATVKLPLTDVV